MSANEVPDNPLAIMRMDYVVMAYLRVWVLHARMQIVQHPDDDDQWFLTYAPDHPMWEPQPAPWEDQ